MKQPNLLFVFTDQHRRHAMGFMNEDPVITPNFDRFATESVVFSQAISSCPLCTPFRAMLMTGRFPLSTGMVNNCQSGLEMGLSDSEVCIGDVLKTNGYQTGYIGKYHLDTPTRNASENPIDGSSGWDAWCPPGAARHGFDFWYSYGTFDDHFHPHYWHDSPEMIQIDQWSVEHETDVAIEFLKKRDPDRPFALFLSWNPPHAPNVAPDEFIELYADMEDSPRRNNPEDLNPEWRHGYFAAVSSCDDQFGRLLRTLEEENLSTDTLVVFTSDHGDMMGSHHRYGKTVWFEESIGIPMLMRWPKALEPRHDDMLFAAYDFMPTILGMMGLPIPDSVEGTDRSHTILSNCADGPNEVALFAFPPPPNALAVGQPPTPYLNRSLEREKLGVDWRQIGFRGLRTSQYTYVVDRYGLGPDGNGTIITDPEAMADLYHAGTLTQRYLYDNLNDPYQLSPIVARNTQENPVMEDLEQRLAQWLERMSDHFPLD